MSLAKARGRHVFVDCFASCVSDWIHSLDFRSRDENYAGKCCPVILAMAAVSRSYNVHDAFKYMIMRFSFSLFLNYGFFFSQS